jgi:hypothetical protein
MPTGPAILDALTTEVTGAITVMDGATTLILGFNDRLSAAVAAALANGATAEQLAPIQSEIDAMAAAADALAAAVAAVPPPTPSV